ncbi:MAG: phosphatase PAP2 family protein [Pseudomonadota bacterium]
MWRFIKSIASQRGLEPRFFVVLFAVCSALWLFLGVAEEVGEGETLDLDTRILLAMHPAGPDGPLGPQWLQEIARDITALGSGVVLALIVVSTCGFLLLARRYRAAILVLVAPAVGSVLNALLKLHFDRPRPTLIPHDIYVPSASFPSGHAMLSATVFLTLAAVLARLAPTFRLKVFVLCLAVLLSGLVGFSRVYLGVHWPSDVLAGWTAGAGWALAAWGVADAVDRNGPQR